MKLNNINIGDKLISEYINHFTKEKSDITNWENVRKELHEAMFKSVNINRFSEKGKKLSKAIDKHCIPFIEKKDYLVAGLKRMGLAKNEEELKQAELSLKNRQLFEELQKKKRGEPSIYSENTCRVCDKELIDGVPRVNDQLLQEGLDADPVDRAICMECGENNPDEHFREFRRVHWNH